MFRFVEDFKQERDREREKVKSLINREKFFIECALLRESVYRI